MSRRKAVSRLVYQPLEPRKLLAADVYEIGFDPVVGMTINSFHAVDPRNPSDIEDIQTNWISAIDELSGLGVRDVNFSVFRKVQSNGNLTGGTDLQTVTNSVAHAKSLGMSVAILPLFETNQGWRGDYNPSGSRRTSFQTDYREWILDLAAIPGVDRFSIASELNAMVEDVGNRNFFQGLINDVASSGYAGLLGFTSNFDIVNSPAVTPIWANPNLDFLGVSAYDSLILESEAELISGTDAVPETVFNLMVQRWNENLDRLETTAQQNDLKVIIKEFGSVKKNYTSIFPFAVNPEEFLNGNQPNEGIADSLEQRATYESLLAAIDGRGDLIDSVYFYSWEHGADRGLRTYQDNPELAQTYLNHFSVWQTDGAGGQAFAEFIATRTDPNDLVAKDDFFDGLPAGALDILSNDENAFGAQITSVTDVSDGRIRTAENGELFWEPSFSRSEIAITDQGGGDKFGYDLAIDGNLAAVAAPYADVNGKINNGAVYVYEKVGRNWIQRAKLVSPANRSGDAFGTSVAMDNGLLLIGAPTDNGVARNAGAAFLYEIGTNASHWTLRQTLTASNFEIADRFGTAVAIDGDRLAIGGRYANDVYAHTGAVYVFQRTQPDGNWEETDIVSSGSRTMARFGARVELKGNNLVVGAPLSNTGSAFLFTLSDIGVETSKTELIDPGTAANDQFGYSIAINDHLIAVGSPDSDTNIGNRVGSVSLFDLQGNYIETIGSPTANSYDKFGYDVALDEEDLFVSAYTADGATRRSGEVLRFQTSGNSTTFVERFEATRRNELTGHAIAVNGFDLLVGAIRSEGSPWGRGHVTAFQAKNMTSETVTFNYTGGFARDVIETPNQGELLGWSIATDGNWAVVGAPQAVTRGDVVGGAVYVYENVNNVWELNTKLAPSTVNVNDHFGHSVAIDGRRIVIGSLYDDSVVVNGGAIYVFELDSDDQWATPTKYVSSGLNQGDRFGYSVDIHQNTIIVGAFNDEAATGDLNTGSASIFEYSRTTSSWAQTNQLFSFDANSGDRFGWAVAIHGNKAIVGAPENQNTGAAYVFTKSTDQWQLERRLVGADSQSGDRFGYSVDIDGQFIAIGARSHAHDGIRNSGAVYLFQYGNQAWRQTQKLVGLTAGQSTVTPGDRFGAAVALSDGRLIVGSPYDDTAAYNAGASYVYEYGDEWSLKEKLLGASQIRGRSGNSVAASRDFVFAGLYSTDPADTDSLIFKNLDSSTAKVTIQFP